MKQYNKIDKPIVLEKPAKKKWVGGIHKNSETFMLGSARD